MSTILRFPRLHARASSREAKRVSKSDVKPAAFARSLAKIGCHQSEGILSRCHHFETARSRAPSSSAIALRESHNSMTERKEDGESTIAHAIRQTVLFCKDILSTDVKCPQRHNVLMKKTGSPSTFKDEFTARVAFARHKAGYTQATMAEALGFGSADDPSAQGKYHKYEKRSLMPHYLIPTFCALCDITVGWLYNGPAVARPVETRGRKPKPIPARKVA
jgi:hypothetical protein